MRDRLRIAPSFRDRLLRRDPSLAQWLRAVPDVYGALTTRRGLVPDGAPRYGGTSIVVPVRTASSQRAALKLVSPVGDPKSEHRALAALAGRGVVGLLETFPRERALLLERLDGPPLAETDDPREAMEIAGTIARAISVVPAPLDAPRLAEQALEWLDGFREQHVRAGRVDNAVPQVVFRAAAAAISELASDTSTTLTHGDLSLENIMRGHDRAWLAIDPLFLRGPVEHEAHTAVRSVLGSTLRTKQPGPGLRDLMRRFCQAAGADETRARAVSHARLVASYYWEVQHDGDPVNVGNLRRAIDLGR